MRSTSPTRPTAAYPANNYLWSGTFVYDGKVYDGIHYRSRGRRLAIRHGEERVEVRL